MKQILPFAKSSAKELKVVQKYNKHSFIDQDGKEIFDAQSGNGAFPFGFDCAEIIDYVAQKIKEVPFVRANNYTTSEAVLQLNEKFKQLSHGRFTHVFYGLSGSDSTETAIKMALSYWKAKRKPEKNKVISFLHGYHGSSFVASSLTGMKAFHKPFKNVLPFEWSIHVNQPRWFGVKTESEIQTIEFESLVELENAIIENGPDSIAAIIKEPFSWQSGVHPSSKNYYQKLSDICHKYDILLIIDDICTGGGKLGTYFGHEWMGIDCDISCNAKGITGGFFPLSATFCNEEVGSVLYDSNFIHGWTFCPSMAGVYSALKTIELWEKSNKVSDISKAMQKCAVNLLDKGLIEGYRVEGVFCGIDIKPEFANGKIENTLWKNGIQTTCYRFDPVLRFILPLSVTQEEIKKLFSSLGNALNEQQTII